MVTLLSWFTVKINQVFLIEFSLIMIKLNDLKLFDNYFEVMILRSATYHITSEASINAWRDSSVSNRNS